MKKLWKLDFAEQGIVYGNEIREYHDFYDLGISEDGEIFLVDSTRMTVSIFSPNYPNDFDTSLPMRMTIEWSN